jgi:hypothetical protein
MKNFVVYTLLRLALFAACFGVLWLPLHSRLGIFPILLIALLISSILAIFVLRGARDRLAGSVANRADRISARIEKSRRAEDDD